jgi:hypothetical protein
MRCARMVLVALLDSEALTFSAKRKFSRSDFPQARVHVFRLLYDPTQIASERPWAAVEDQA